MITKYFVDANGRYLGGFQGDTGALPEGAIEVLSPPGSALWVWSGTVWNEPPVIPPKVKMVQARLALLQRGYLSQAQAIIDAMTGDEGTAARIQWEFSEHVERIHTLVQGIKTQLPLTEAELDDLFTLADTL